MKFNREAAIAAIHRRYGRTYDWNPSVDDYIDFMNYLGIFLSDDYLERVGKEFP